MNIEDLIAILDTINNEELLDKIAEIYRNLFNSLTKAGFSREQAMQILTSMKLNQ